MSRVPRIDPAALLICVFFGFAGVALLAASTLTAEALVAAPLMTSIRVANTLVAMMLCVALVHEVHVASREPVAAHYRQNLEREVDNHRLAEVSLRRNEARYRSLIDASCSLVWVTDQLGQKMVDGGGVQDLTGGLTNGEPLEWPRVIHPSDLTSFVTRWRAGIASGRAFEGEARFVSDGDQDYRTSLVRAAPVLGDDGSVAEWVVSLRDIDEIKRTESERRNLQQRALESKHFESLGVLAGGLAHDFNNLLVGVMGHAELIARRVEANSPLQENATCIVDSAERAAQLCKKMLAFAGKGRYLPERSELAIVVKNMQQSMVASMPKHIKLSFEHQENVPSVDINPDELRQLLAIFVTNSVEALEARTRGQIRVVTGSRFFSAEELALTKLGSACLEGVYAFLEVHDDGPGIAPDIMPKIFEPFFSTKFLGRGLSLAAALGIARTHAGTVDITSRQGATCARLLLPVLRPDSDINQLRPVVGREAQGTVLVVDDDTDVRELARLTLEDIGVRVMTASSGEECVKIYRELHAEIDLVLLDLTMPGMDGATALRALSEIQPGVRVILTSGYLAADAIERIGAQGVEGFVQKPWRPSALAKRMSNALARRGEALWARAERN
ncbi:MAG: response regulator [Myxococcales bacterium]